METLIHSEVAAARDGRNPSVIGRVRSGWAVLGQWQFITGYSLLLPDPVVPSLNDLSVENRSRFLLDMVALGDALLAVTNAVRIRSKGLFHRDFPYFYQPFYGLLFTYAELPEAIRIYNFDARIADAKRRDMWTGAYIEAHIWDPDIKSKIKAGRPISSRR